MTVLEKLIELLKELKVKSAYDLNKPSKYSGEYRIALNHAIDRCNLLLEDEQEMLKEYHRAELLKLNKSDVIRSLRQCTNCVHYRDNFDCDTCNEHLDKWKSNGT